MTSRDRQQWIERYLGGEMTSTEEQEFYIQVALDPEMRRMLRAYRIVESTFRKDRDAIQLDNPRVRMYMLAMLAETPRERAATAAAGGSRGQGIESSGLAATTLLKWFSGVATITLTAAVTLTVLPDSGEKIAPRTSSVQAVQIPASLDETAGDSSDDGPDAGLAIIGKNQEVERKENQGKVSGSAATAAARIAPADQPIPSDGAKRIAGDAGQAPHDSAARKRGSDPTVVDPNDTLNINVKLDLEGLDK